MLGDTPEQIFGDTPKWVEQFAQENASIGSADELSERRLDEQKDNVPWTIYLESIALGRGFNMEKVVAFISRFHSYQIIPINVSLIEPKDYSEYFPNEIRLLYHALPVCMSETFLNIALLEPEVARDISEAYYAWIGDRRLKALQFFVTTPSAFNQYSSLLNRIQARKEG